MRLAVPCLLLIICSACVQFPEIDAATDQVARDADYPDLVPLDTVPTPTAEARTEREETEAALQARVQGLQSRAARLRGSVLSTGERSRLADQIQ